MEGTDTTPSSVARATVVEKNGAGVNGRANGAERDVSAHLSAHLVHRVDVESHRVLGSLPMGFEAAT